ncbi:MAG: hypothetical protein IJK74_06850 [Bacteroidales bacterium]|nr:hypothetical protein [Bacteroidales bacterium]
MGEKEKIQLFEDRKIRSVWDEEKEKWFFSVVDVVAVLSGSPDPAKYWRVLKTRLKKEGNETATNCSAFKMKAADGKMRMTDMADMQQMFRIIQSVPSSKAEPFKVWMAKVASERIDQMIDPEKSIDQAVADYRRLGYSEAWINRRIKSIEIRKGLTDEWKRGGVTQEIDFAFLTDLMSKTWSGFTTKEYKKFKGLTKENLRDNMTNLELLLSALAEETATQISKERNPDGLKENATVAHEGAEVAKSTRGDIDKRLGHSVVTSEKAIDYIQPADELPFPKKKRKK